MKPQALIIMGVAGSGKTTVGEALADKLNWQFADADNFHPAENVVKMSQGTPLTDTDRQPWLFALQQHIQSCLENGQSLIVACSALKQHYRDILRAADPRVSFVYLKGSYELILSRMQARTDHFMKPEMLQSQFVVLEEPANALTIEIAADTEAIVLSIMEALKL